MDLNASGSSRINRHRRSPSSDRFLCAYTPAPRQNPSPSSDLNTNDDELNEDDIFTTDFSLAPIASSSFSSPSSSLGQRNLNGNGGFRSKSSFKAAEASGILVALPETSGNNHHHHQYFNHKAAALSPSVSSIASSSSSSAAYASSSAARMIPSIPKPPQERIPFPSSSIAGGKYPQSAPVNVPVLSHAMRRRRREFDDVDLDEEEEEGEMLPPHEMVARSLARSPILSSSVLEGAGRTLKGRDLRQVRNAVFRQTGFID